MSKNQIIYSLTIEDTKEVIRNEAMQQLSSKEMKAVIDEIQNNISWYGIIFDSIQNIKDSYETTN